MSKSTTKCASLDLYSYFGNKLIFKHTLTNRISNTSHMHNKT